MFQVRLITRWGYEIVTVYAVDFNRDAFLIGRDDRFKWVRMDECAPM